MNENTGRNECTVAQDGRPGRKRHGFWAGIVLGGVLGAAIVGGLAWTGSGVLAAGSPFGGWHGRGMRGGFSPEMCRDRAEFMTEWALHRLDATEEQKSKVMAISSAAVNDLCALREKHRGTRDEILNELTKPKVDPEAIESHRKQQIALADEASKIIAGAVTQAADVLTVEQRQQLVDHLKQMHEPD